jgi:hypothetical protein
LWSSSRDGRCGTKMSRTRENTTPIQANATDTGHQGGATSAKARTGSLQGERSN